ncbi:MAG TPA: adenosylhomocysteinase [Firmicutes bacterium]|jgi:adenosylhomocysteinase|nr:adenosylhomocysteinase [Bacillota bacterium]HBG43958.1 adenosylhomocysteinase [Bacillota bacterium]HCF91369.1 adenosylhomocysteinase [Bacillota bacterium]
MQAIVRDMKLASEGHLKIDWAWQHMPLLNALKSEFEKSRPFLNKRMAISVHLEAKTACLALVLKAAGADVAVTGSNPLSTQDAIAAALVERGIPVFAWHGATTQEYKEHLAATLDIQPELFLDDGGDLTTMLHGEKRSLLSGVKGGCEETTTGLMRMRAMAKAGKLAFPMIAVNDADCKHLFDNRYGTGQSVWDGIMRTTNLIVAGKNVVVAGFGWCGKGVAMRAKGLGANVIVTEVDPVRALEAVMEGFRVMPMIEAAALGDIFITVTGCCNVIGRAHFERMRDGALLCNAGHFDVEVNKTELKELACAQRLVRKNIEEFELPDGHRLYLLGEGRLVNLAAGDGHPVEIMDMSFAIQALALEYLSREAHNLEPGVHPVPAEIDHSVAHLKLRSLGCQIDELKEEQRRYLNGWED